MFCRYCGKETDSPVCPDCAAKAQAEQAAPAPEAVQPEVAPVPEAAPATEPVMNLGVEEAAPKKKKSKKKLWISLVAILAVVGVLAYFLLPWSYWTTPADEMFREAEAAALSSYTDSLSRAYGALVKNDAPVTQYNSATSTLELEVGSLVAPALSEALKEAGISLSPEQLQKLSVSSNFTLQNDLLQAGVSVQDMLDIQAFLNLSDSMVYLSLPQLNDQALSANVSEIFGTSLANLFAFNMEDIDEDGTFTLVAGALKDPTFKAAMPSEQDFDAMLDRCVTAALSAITQVEKSSITVTVDGVSQDQYVLTATINEATARNMLKAALQSAQNDATVKAILNAVNDYILRTTGENYNLSAMVNEAIPMLITELTSQPISSSNAVVMETYVNEESEVLGRKFSVTDDGQTESISYNFVEDGNTSYYEYRLPENIRIHGTVVEEGDLTTTTIKLPVYGENLPVTLTVKCSPTLFSIRLTPPQELIDEAIFATTANAGVPSSLIPNNLALELAFEQPTEAQFNVSLRFLAGETSIIALTAKNQLSNNTITLPQDAADVTDATDMMLWVYESYNKLPGVLRSFGLSETMIEDVLNMVMDDLF